MSRVTGYACVFASKTETWKFALELKGEADGADIAVTSADSAETLLDLFEDASHARFDRESGEISFAFDYSPSDDEDEEAEGEESETAEETDGEEETEESEVRAA